MHLFGPQRKVVSVNCLCEANSSKAAEELVIAMLDGTVTTVSESIIFLRCLTPFEVASSGKFKTKKQLSCCRLVAVPESLLAELSAFAKPSLTETKQSDLRKALRENTSALRLLEQLLLANRMLSTLEERRRTEFCNDDPAHESKLRAVWSSAFGSETPFERPSEKWGEIGFQGKDPVTDLRGGGMLALDCFANLCQTDPALLHRMIDFNKAQLRAERDSWYLPAVVSIQFSVQLLVPQHVVSNMTPNLVLNKAQLDVLFQESRSFDGQGYFALHHRMMTRFADQWERDLPHVMEYNTWIPKMYEAFFR